MPQRIVWSGVIGPLHLILCSLRLKLGVLLEIFDDALDDGEGAALVCEGNYLVDLPIVCARANNTFSYRGHRAYKVSSITTRAQQNFMVFEVSALGPYFPSRPFDCHPVLAAANVSRALPSMPFRMPQPPAVGQTAHLQLDPH